MKTYYIIPILFILVFTACEKVIEFDKKLIQPKLVINSFITADSIIDVKLASSKTIPGVEHAFVWPDDAIVKLFVDGVETETLSTYTIEYPESDQFDYWGYTSDSRPTVGYHSSTTRAIAGKTYRLEVSHPNYESVSTETFIPQKVEIIAYSNEETTENQNGYDYTYQTFHIKFKDTEGENNYYQLAIHSISGSWSPNYKDETDSSGVIYVSEYNVSNVSSDDRLLNPDQEDANDFLFGSPSNRYNLFTDEFIDGKEYDLSFSVDKNYYYYDDGSQTDSEKIGEFNRYTITLKSITREAYLYLRSSYAQQWYGDDFFSEPVQAFSNVENGAGIFAGFNSAAFSVQQGEYPVDGVKYEYMNNYY
ncbi:MAG: DUF4249 domain-containing protein [Prolixibacteraceae bacterium]